MRKEKRKIIVGNTEETKQEKKLEKLEINKRSKKRS